MTKNSLALLNQLSSLEGKGYKAYKSIKGEYDFQSFKIIIDHVQGDPFAAPSKIRVQVRQDLALFPEELWVNSIRQVALENYIFRAFAESIRNERIEIKGTGHSGLIRVAWCGQEVLKRSGVSINKDRVELRFEVGLPAFGRRIAGREARKLFEKLIPVVVENSLFAKSHELNTLKSWVEKVEDQEFLRNSLSEKDLVAFVADGSVLPRISGADDRPLSGKDVIPFKSPESLKVSFSTPNSGEVSGMGIQKGVTLIVGGGYHGKSTLLKAIEHSVYNHIPGDGREMVVCQDDAVMIRSEDGRSVSSVCISSFISNLPYGKNTDEFTSQDSSGSTSQAANIMESLEQGSKMLLIDEDTSANNFLIRDGRMQRLISKDREPIIPFIDRVRLLYKEQGISTILVLGGSGDYFEVADTVIAMQEYLPAEVTKEAKEIVKSCDSKRDFSENVSKIVYKNRSPDSSSFNPFRGRKIKIDARMHELVYGRDKIDLQFLSQIVDIGQIRFIGDFIYHLAERRMDGKLSLRDLIEDELSELDKKGFDFISPMSGSYPGDYAIPRKFEISAAINRLRTLKVRQV